MVAVGIVSSTGLLIASARAEDAGPRSGSPRAGARPPPRYRRTAPDPGHPRAVERADGTVAAWRVAADGATVDVIRTCDFHGPADGVAPSASLSSQYRNVSRHVSERRDRCALKSPWRDGARDTYMRVCLRRAPIFPLM